VVGLEGECLSTTVVAFAEGVAQGIVIGAVGLACKLQERVDRFTAASRDVARRVAAWENHGEQNEPDYKPKTMHNVKMSFFVLTHDRDEDDGDKNTYFIVSLYSYRLIIYDTILLSFYI
jgi:hypothetical protein